MRWTCILPAAAAVLLAASPALGSGAERHEDAIGDATGDSPDIVAVTVSEPDEGPLVRFEIELAPERPFGTDMDTWSDTVFILMSHQPDVDERGILSGDVYTTGTHGVTLPMQEQSGALLVTDSEMYWLVVDVDAAGSVLTFTVDRKLIGDPTDLYWQVLLGVERFEEGADADEAEMEGDGYPELDEPPGHYHLSGSNW